MKDLITEIRKALGDTHKALADKLETAADAAVAELDEAKQASAAATKAQKAAEKERDKHKSDLDAKGKGESEELATLRAERDALKTRAEKAEADIGTERLTGKILRKALGDGLVDEDGLKVLDVSGISLDDKGDLVGYDKASKAWKAAKPYLFSAKTQAGDDGGKGPDAGDKGGKGGGGGGGEPNPSDVARQMLQRQGFLPTQQQGAQQ